MSPKAAVNVPTDTKQKEKVWTLFCPSQVEPGSRMFPVANQHYARAGHQPEAPVVWNLSW